MSTEALTKAQEYSGPNFNHPYVGRVVIYDGRHGGSKEQGVVTSVNEHYIFARFGHGSTSAACSPGSLTFLDGTRPDLAAYPALATKENSNAE
jgi:hypothetical protein